MRKPLLYIMCLAAMMAVSISAKAQEVTVVLTPGWTWISYPSTDTLDFATALGDFIPMQGDIIKSQWGQARYTSGAWRGAASQFYPGYGYHYKSNRQTPVVVTFNAQPPAPQVVVTTSEPTDITANSATSGGSITTDAYVFAKGICWATHSNPTQADDYYSENGSGDENFTAEMTDLSQNTMYYVRAYVVMWNGITYGNEVNFTTIPIWTIEATPNPTDGGTITGTGDYEQNAVCTLTAIANEGYIFTNWTENGEVVSTDATYTFTVDAARSLVANFDLDHTYIDLGLPSGLLWATCNLGATLPEEYGDYFAWGETQPKDNFSWTNYQHCMGSFNTLTKYCNNPDIGYNGFTDDLTTLLPEDDAATANWGDEWRMPTQAEWQELYQNTTVTWTTQNGVRGRLFTASNGNSLFLPAAGYCNESIPEASGIIGDYWTSSLDTDYPSGAMSFFFNSSNYYISFCNRLYGRNVRAVYSESQNTSYIIDATANPAEGGVVTGGGSYFEGTECTLTATTNEGYTFTNWTENDEVVSAGATYSFTVNADRTLVANFTSNGGSGGDHEYVDLGLPSGLLWATCNVGADAPEEYGDYFAWGETQPKDYYDPNWSNYQYSYGGSFNNSNLTKYCNNSSFGYNGFTDSLTTLLPEDDAATANWGNGWHMPTKEEWQELFLNTSNQRVAQNDVDGWLFTAPNGNTLFLPAAGIRTWDYLSNDSNGYYWSSSLFTSGSSCAWHFGFDSEMMYGVYVSSRANGCSIRAVRSSVQNSTPTGAINGKFTINANGDQVYFSQGNLQYQASTNTWKFADNQYDYVGSTNSNISSFYSGWIDLFGWGTSGYHDANDPYNVNYQPWSTSTSQVNSSYNNYGYGPSINMIDPNLTGTNANYDWGVYNPISNGGNQTNQWRTLTMAEWIYIFDARITTSGSRYAKANVNNVNGVILLPDNWSMSIYNLSNTNMSDASYNSNTLTTAQWGILEQSGAVFLPASGNRSENSVDFVGSKSSYWSASYGNSYSARRLYFDDSFLSPQGSGYRSYGLSVRLVSPVE